MRFISSQFALALIAALAATAAPQRASAGDNNHLLEPASKGDIAGVQRVFFTNPDAIRMFWHAQPGQPERGYTMLHFAARRGDVEMCEFLIRSGAPVNAKDANGQTPLHLAANPRIVVALLNGRAEVDPVDLQGQTPLGTARNTDVAQLLIDHKAAINRPGVSPLHAAAGAGRLELVRKLLAVGAKVDAEVPAHESLQNRTVTGPHTALYLAARGGHNDVVMLLAAHNARLDAPDVQPVRAPRGAATVPHVPGLAPLWGAVSGGHPQTVRLLLQLGADPHITGEVGRDPTIKKIPTEWTLLHLAAAVDPDGRITRELLRAGLKPDVRSNRADGERTPLHLAAERGNLAVAKLLIAHGADVEAETAGGQTPLTLAEQPVKQSGPGDRAATAQLLRLTGALR